MERKCKWGKSLMGMGVLMLLAAAFLAGPATVNAGEGEYESYEVVDGNYYWYRNLDDGTVAVIFSTSGDKDRMVFPAELDGKKVTAIERFRNGRITCKNLTSVVLPDTLTRIGDDVFSGCPNLQEANIPKGVTSIGKKAFRNCKIQAAELPEGLKSIGEEAFTGCGGLKSLQIPSTVTEMGAFAFSNCGMTSLEIGNGVIGWAAFSGCSKLKSIRIPGKVSSIPNGAFNVCSALEQAVIEEGVRSIGSDAFKSCPKLKKITIAKSVTSISKDAGFGEAFINNGTIKDNVKVDQLPKIYCYTNTAAHRYAKDIGLPYVLMDAKARKGNTFTAGKVSYKVTKAGANPEVACTGSKSSSVTIPDTVKDTQGISYKVTSIGASAFKGKGLKKITIGKNVKTIGKNAFYNCKKLSSVTIKSTKLSSVGKNSLKGIHAKAKIRVLAKKLSAYKKLLKGKGQGKKVTVKKS